MAEMDDVFRQIAQDNLGIYPAANNGVPRTEWQDGWNACCMEISKSQSALTNWWISLKDEERTAIKPLLLNGELNLDIDGDNVSMSVNCSDMFWWGTSDAEEITMEELPQLVLCLGLSKNFGGVLWCARKRKMRPQGALYERYLPKNEWAIFNACGPHRPAEVGNPSPTPGDP